ncbi:MAG: TIM barrel protein [Thermoplasmatota archaeon]
MIRFGPGGIPLSCKGRTQRDGIEDVHTLGLNAMEIQFVRVNLFERYVADEEVGLRPREVANEFVVDVIRGRRPMSVFLPDLRLEKGDIIRTLNSGVGRDAADMRELGEIASDLDVQLALHAPYYMDLLGSEDIATRSIENLRLAGLLAKEIGADIVVTHVGFYHDQSSEEAISKLAQIFRGTREWYDRMGIRARIGLETSGKRVVFGSLDELLALCKQSRGLVPVLSFPHIHAREGGILKRKEDFRELFERVREALRLEHFYTHFSGVEHEGGNELRYTPIKKGDMRFEPLAEYLAEELPQITVISDSPLLEHDAMYMKVILERVLLKNEARVVREEVRPAAPIRPPAKPIAPPVKKPARPAKAGKAAAERARKPSHRAGLKRPALAKKKAAAKVAMKGPKKKLMRARPQEEFAADKKPPEKQAGKAREALKSAAVKKRPARRAPAGAPKRTPITKKGPAKSERRAKPKGRA